MDPNSGALFPPLGKSPQRAKTAHTTSSLPIAGSARVSTHPLLPPHHIRRRNQVHLHLRNQQHRHDRGHARHKTDSAKAPCSMTDHIVGLYEAPELPEVEVLLRQGAASRATIVQMIAQGICRTSFNDVQRFPAIHPSIMSARKDRIVRYITFVSAPPFERRAPKDRPKSWDRRVFKPLGPEECFHCQLKTDHAVCERHKYLRVGGGFRHSYWYIKQTLDIIEAEHRKVAEEVRKRYEEEQLALKAKQGQTRRRIKMYVKGADGKIVSRYQFVTEEEYEEMKKDSKLAKKILGLADDEELDDWVSSKQKYVMDAKGELVKVSRQKYGDSAFEESLESGIGGRSRRHRGRRHGDYSDSDSFESGMGHSILEDDEAGRRRRRRHGRRRYSSVESVESYISEGGTRRERTVRRRRRRRSRDSSGSSYEDEDGNRQRRHRRRRRRGSGSDSGTELDSNDSRSRRRRHRRHGGRHRGRHRDDYSDGSYDSYDSRDGGGKGRGRRRRGGRRGSYSSGSDDSRSRRRGRRHRGRYSSSYSDESNEEGGKGRRRKGGRRHRHRRGHSSGSSDYSDSDDSRGRRRRHRRHRRDGSGGSTDGSLSVSGEDGDRRHHRRGRRHRKRYSDDDYSGSEEGHRKGRRHRRRYSDESESGSEGGGHRRRRRHRRRHSGDSDGSRSEDYDSEDDTKGGRRRRRRRRGSRSYSDSYSYSDGDGGSAGHGKHGRRRRRHRRRHSSDDYSDDVSYDTDDDRRGGKRKGGRKHHGGRHRRRGRRHSRGGSGSEGSYSDGSSYDSYDDSSSVSLSDSSEVSDASTPSSVHSSDLSDIDSNLDEEERIRIKAEKKAKKMLEKRAAKQQLKEETRKEAREAKREQIRREHKERRREEGGGRRRNRREKRRRHRTPTSRDVSACSSVSTVNSDDISDVDSALVGEERRLAKEAKKAKKREQKKELKQKEKVKKVQEQHREKRREKERQRIKREIEREMDRMSTPSDVSSVRSSDLSSVSDEEGLTAEEKAARKEERKKKKKEEKMREKKLMKAVNKVMAKRKKKGRGNSGSSDDSYSRGKQDFYNLTSQVVKSMVKYSKGSKRGLVDDDGMEWLDDWKNQKTKEGRKKKGKKGKDQEDGDTIELTAPDGRKIRVPKSSLYDVWKLKKKIRLKKDGTVARDSDSDAESIEIDSDGNMATQPKTVTFEDTKTKWTGFASTPELPLTPTQGGKIKFQGVRKVQHAFRKDRGVLTEHLKRVLDTASELSFPRPGDREEARRGYHQNTWESIDFLNHYRLVEGYKLDPLGRAFVVEDVDYDCTLTAEEMRSAIEGVPSLSAIKPKQLEYVLRVLNIDDHTDITFKMFAVISGVCERMCNMDSFGKYILDKTDLLDVARKMALYKSIFYCNVNSERSVNHITSESLQIELMAGGLSKDQERYIMSKMNPNEYREISFFDYMAYIPLFLSMHENIIDNPLDRHEKYTTRLDYGEVQRDMNPMGLPLQREYLGVPKEIFPSGIPPRSPEDGTREFIERGDLLEDMVVGGKTGRLPSIGKKISSPMSAKRGGRMKDPGLSMSLP